MKLPLPLICALGLFLMAGTVTAVDDESDKTPYSSAIKSPDAAVARALQFTGFDRTAYCKDRSPSEMAKLVTIMGDVTPYLCDSINGRQSWRVTFDSVFIEVGTWVPSVLDNQIPKTFDVFLDAETGRLLKIVSRYDGGNPDLADEPPPDIAVRSMKSESYDGFPEDPPKIDFYQALGAAAPSSPIMADQIIAHCVVHSNFRYKRKPVWIVQGRGVPPMTAGGRDGGEVAICDVNRVRSIVDAVGGKLWQADNRPLLSGPCNRKADSGGGQ